MICWFFRPCSFCQRIESFPSSWCKGIKGNESHAILPFEWGTSGPKMMGYHTAFSNLGRIVTKLLAGDLASYGWSLPFNVYWIGPSCLAPSSHSSDKLRHKNKGASNYLEAPFRLCMDYR